MRALQPVLLGAALALTGCVSGTTSGSSAAADHVPRAGVEVRLRAVDAAGKGTQAQWQNERLTLREPPIASSADIADVRSVLDESGLAVLQIRYRPEAQQCIHESTAAMVGQRIAVSVDGRILSVATVQGPFAESMRLSGLPANEARNLAKHITGQ